MKVLIFKHTIGKVDRVQFRLVFPLLRSNANDTVLSDSK